METICFFFLLFCSTLISSAQCGAAVAPVACPTVCTAFVAGGIGALDAVLIATGIGAPFAAALTTALTTAGAAGGAGLTIAGCTTVCMAAAIPVSCFDQHAHVEISQNGVITNIPIHQLQVGNVVRSVNEKSTMIQIFARVNHISESNGDFQFYQFKFDNERQTAINVTAPHLMILCEIGNHRMGTKSARSVKVGDSMIVTDFDDYGNVNERCTYVKNVAPFYAHRKINVETDTGTILANGVFVTGICENNEGDKSGEAVSVLSKYRMSHGFDKL